MYSVSHIERSFHLRCDAGAAGSFSANAVQVSVIVGQRILRGGKEQIWDGVVVHSSRESDGTLRTRVLLCNPDWEEPLEIATVESTVLKPPSNALLRKL